MSNEDPTDALRLVPVEPTWDQLVAMRDCCAELSGIEADSETMLTALYRAALKAAPASPLPGGGGEALIAELKEARGLLQSMTACSSDYLASGSELARSCKEGMWGELLTSSRAFLARNGKGEG